MPTFFIDYENGNDNYSGSSFAVLASGTDGAIASPTIANYSTFSSASANFANDGTITSTKNLAWYGNSYYFMTIQQNATINTTTISPPTGIDSTVFSLIEDTSSNTHYIQSTTWYTPIYEVTQYTLSIYAKSNGKNKLFIRYGTDARSARYNLSNGTVEATGASATASISSIGNGWYRLSLTSTTGGSSSSTYSGDNWEIYITQDSYVSLTASSTSYQGNGYDGVYLCGMQLETGSSATTYEKPVLNTLSIYNGSSYVVFYITQRLNATTLRLNTINSGATLSLLSSQQYYIGGRWKTITNGATAVRTTPGDNIRLMGSPAPTLIGSGTWTAASYFANAAISSSTNASPIVVTCGTSMATLGISNGDTVQIAGHATNTNANGTWEVTNVTGSSCTLVNSTGNGVGGTTGYLKKRTNHVVRLNSAVTQNIASCGNRGEGRTAWTQSSNVTASLLDTDSKEGDVSDSIVVGASFTTGKAAYKATGTLNLSTYQQLSFYIKQTAGTVNVSGDISLRLCSDTTGDTTVHTFNIENLVALNTWVPITIDLGSNMNSSIQSIALYVDSNKGTKTLLLSNIIACKAKSSNDSLNLQSIIGKNTANEPWCPVMSINGTRVILGMNAAYSHSTTLPAYRYGYDGTSETVNTYKRETIKIDLQSTANSIPAQINEGGVIGNPISYIGGWDRTNMSTQTLETWFDARNGLGWGVYINSINSISLQKISFVRYDRAIRVVTVQGLSTFSDINAIGCTNYGLDFGSATNGATLTNLNCSFNGGNAVYMGFGAGSNIINNLIMVGNSTNAFYGYQSFSNNIISNFYARNNAGNGLIFDAGANNTYVSGTMTWNSTNGFRHYAAMNENFISCTTSNNGNNANNGFYVFGGEYYLKNCIVNEPSEFGTYGLDNGKIYSSNHDNTSGNYIITANYGIIVPQTSVRNSNSGYAWALSPTSSVYRISSYPLDLKIATVAVSANAQVTIKAWMKRTSIALNFRLRVKGGQIAGVTNDVTSYMTAAADTWEQVSLTFTPTEAGVVEIFAECWGGSTYYGYVDDLTIIQA